MGSATGFGMGILVGGILFSASPLLIIILTAMILAALAYAAVLFDFRAKPGDNAPQCFTLGFLLGLDVAFAVSPFGSVNLRTGKEAAGIFWKQVFLTILVLADLGLLAHLKLPHYDNTFAN